MKKLFLSATAIATVMSASAFAADLPSVKSAPVVAPAPIWTGFYAGLNTGYGFGTNDNAYASTWEPQGFTAHQGGSPIMPLSGVGLAQSGSVSNNQNGFIGGFQTGYNYQFKENFLVGLEADIQGTNIGGSGNRSGFGYNQTDLNNGSATTIGDVQVSSGVDWLGTVRGRAGYLWNPSLLLFGTAGLTYGGVHSNITNLANTQYVDISNPEVEVGVQTFYGTTSRAETLVGWNAGGGLEWMVSQNWSVKAEALYWNLGNINVNTTAVSPNAGSWLWTAVGQPLGRIPASAASGNTNINYQGIIARAGINYHFNFASVAPVVAKF